MESHLNSENKKKQGCIAFSIIPTYTILTLPMRRRGQNLQCLNVRR